MFKIGSQTPEVPELRTLSVSIYNLKPLTLLLYGLLVSYDVIALQQQAYYKIIPTLKLYTCVSFNSYFLKALLVVSTWQNDAVDQQWICPSTAKILQQY